MNSDNPILISPYEEPEWHYATEVTAHSITTTYETAVEFLLPSLMHPIAAGAYGDQLVNLIRKEIGIWRNEKNPNNIWLVT